MEICQDAVFYRQLCYYFGYCEKFFSQTNAVVLTVKLLKIGQSQKPDYHPDIKTVIDTSNSFSLFFSSFATSIHNMASTKPLAMLVVRSRPTGALCNSARRLSPMSANTLAAFSTTTFRAATPSGPPPAGFRLPQPERWDQSKESSLDKAGKYFLLTEMFRGMYVVLEQFFRPP